MCPSFATTARTRSINIARSKSRLISPIIGLYLRVASRYTGSTAEPRRREMKKSVTVICIREVGNPLDVVRVEKWELPALQPHQALVDMKAAPINPADLNVLEGKYIVRPTLPAVVGNEGVGVVAECGSAVA